MTRMNKKMKMAVSPQQPLPSVATTTTTSDAFVSTTPLALLGNTMCDELMLEILSRLPAKSLMRFKCVSKSWLYLIEEDKHFISLHSSQSSKSHKKLLLIGLSCGSHGTGLFTLDFFKKSTEFMRSSPHKLENKHILRSSYGLLCFIRGYSFQIYNLFTREETPWIQSDFAKKKTCIYSSLGFGFGFDPVTKKHKVLIMWTTHGPNVPWKQDEVPFCEVLTVGENTWRTIDDVPSMRSLYGKPTYTNGSIYWLMKPSSHSLGIIKFDVGKEKLTVIKFPDTITNDRLLRNTCEIDYLVEVDGHLGLIESRSYRHSKMIGLKMKIWVLMEDENKKSSGRWVEETNELPFYVTSLNSFESIPETDMIMATNVGWKKGLPGIYVYDRKKKEFNNYSSLEKLGRGNEGKEMYFRDPYYCVELTNIVESIYPVRSSKQLVNKGEEEEGQTSTQHHLQ